MAYDVPYTRNITSEACDLGNGEYKCTDLNATLNTHLGGNYSKSDYNFPALFLVSDDYKTCSNLTVVH